MSKHDLSKHVGYCISGYDGSKPVYSVPIDVTSGMLRLLLRRDHPINAVPLNSEEFREISGWVIGAIELYWNENFEFYVEGMNLPEDWE